jgi:hypothetical protein
MSTQSNTAAHAATSASQLLTATTTPLPPTITGFTPTVGFVGSSVQIDGTHLAPVTQVKFNGVLANYTVVTSQIINATVPLGATTGPITVVSPGGTAQSPANFVIPMITSIVPQIGIPGTNVQINGHSLSSVNKVTFTGSNGPVNAIIAGVTDVYVGVIVPVGTITGPITVSGPGFSLEPLNMPFVVPMISGITPTSGKVGSTVTISGSHLGQATAVEFAGMNTFAKITFEGGQQIQVTVPLGAQTGPITVFFPGFSLQTQVFTVTL